MAEAGAVVFDCDGVLVDSEPLMNAVLVASLARHGLELDARQARLLFNGGTLRSVAAEARSLGARLPEDWVEATYAEVYRVLRKGTPAVPGIVALLDALDAASVPYAVASNGSPKKMSITLGQTGLWQRFERRMLSAHVAGVAKPDPGLFLMAAELLGQPPGACVVVGDSPADCIAARAAGMRCLGFAPDGDGARLEAEGAIVVRSMAEAARELGL